MKRTNGIGPEAAISAAMAAMRSGCPVLTEGSNSVLESEKATPQHMGDVCPSLGVERGCRVAFGGALSQGEVKGAMGRHVPLGVGTSFRSLLCSPKERPIVPAGALRLAQRSVINTSHSSSEHSPHAPWHFLYFFPLPQGQGSLRPTLFSARWAGACAATGSSPRFNVSLGCGREMIGGD